MSSTNMHYVWENTNWQRISSCLWLWFRMEMSSLLDFISFPLWFRAPFGWLAVNQLAALPSINTLSSLDMQKREQYSGAQIAALCTNPAGILLNGNLQSVSD